MTGPLPLSRLPFRCRSAVRGGVTVAGARAWRHGRTEQARVNALAIEAAGHVEMRWDSHRV